MATSSPRRVALLVVDMINPLDFPGARALRRQAIPVAGAIARLKARLKPRGVPVVYVNDNFTQWLRDFHELVAICSAPKAPGAALLAPVVPEHDDYLVLKPRQSGFHAAPLEVLLRQLGVGHLVITGIAGDGCVMNTATDAHMREFAVTVPSDCCASITAARNQRALHVLRDAMGIDTRASRFVRG
ncbi:MAG TPA: isochorismatase family cysteine hydrolase [Xanthomonadaceae bacterium]|nr:isochorismatase family cysteine hydrolase [Xanthomonadaceae bacterium]